MDKFVILVTFFSPLFIFNFTSLFILAQENFHKFNSIKLLNMVVSPLVILCCIMLPALIVLLAIAGIIPENIRIFYTVCGLIYGTATSLYLLRRLKKMLDPIYAVKKIISEIKSEEFSLYKERKISNGQSNFDDLLKLCCGTIERNDEFESAEVFKFIFNWLSQHIDSVKPGSKFYWDRQNIKFNDFFETIVEKINQKDNSFIKNNYVKEIYSAFFYKLDYKDFDKIYYQLKSLKRLLDISIERGLSQDNYVANNIFHAIIDPCQNILSKIDASQYTEAGYVAKSENYKNFNECILESILQIYELSIKYENVDLISHTFIFCRFFNSYKDNNSSESLKWGGNHLQCYFDVFSIYKKIIKVKNYDRKCIDFVLHEYSHLCYQIKYQDTSRTVIKHLFNAYMNDLANIFAELIEHVDSLNAEDFDIYCGFWNKWDIPYYYQGEIYMKVFLDLLKKVLDKYSGQKTKGRLVNNLWLRTEQISEYLNSSEKRYANDYQNLIKNLKNEYSESYADFQRYKNAINVEIKQLKKAMSEEIFKP